MARHYNHGDGRYPIAHSLVTSHYASGPVRFPVDSCIYRRYEEVTQWETFVHKHFPDQEIPTRKKARARLHKEAGPILMQDPEFAALDKQFKTKITLAIELIHKAIERNIPFGIVLFDSWYLSKEMVAVLTDLHKDWVSLLKKRLSRNFRGFAPA